MALADGIENVLRTETESDLLLSDYEIASLTSKLIEAVYPHVAETGCNLKFEDFAGADDQPCADGGLPLQHPHEEEKND